MDKVSKTTVDVNESREERSQIAESGRKLTLRRKFVEVGSSEAGRNCPEPQVLPSARALLESEQRYHTLFEGALNPIMLIDGEGNFSECNGASQKFFDCSREELLCRNLADFVPPGKDRIIPRELLGLWNRGDTIENEYYINNSIKALELTISTIELQGQLLVLAVGQDITKRKLAEKELLESEEKFRTLTEQSLLGIAIYAGDRFHYVNGALAELVGYSANELLSWDLKRIQQLVHPHDLLFGFRRLEESELSSNDRGTFYLRIVCKDKTERSVEIYSRTVTFCGETAYLVNMIDVTEKKQARNKLEELNRILKLEQAALREKNVVLTGVLSQIDYDKEQIKVQIQANIDKVILPTLRSMRESAPMEMTKYIDLIHSGLTDITNPYISKLQTDFATLSPREMEICNMIKEGFSSKDIASAGHVSVQTVNKQRKRIRHKLGICSKEINLASYLRSQ